MKHRMVFIFWLTVTSSLLFSLFGCQGRVEPTTATVTKTMTETVVISAAPVTITTVANPVTTTITSSLAPVTVTVTHTTTVTATNSQTPTVPVKISPADKSVFSTYPRTTTLKWSASQGVTPITYLLEIQYSWAGDKQNFGSWLDGDYQTYVMPVNVTQYVFDFVGGQPGRWRIKAMNQYGVSDWSEWWYFRYTS